MSSARRIAASIAILASVSSAQAANWTNYNGGNWNYGPWWNTGLIPGTGENVNILNGAFSDFTVVENTGYTPETALGNIVVNTGRPLEITLGLTDMHSDLYAANETIGDAGHATVKHTGHSTNGISGSLILGKSAGGRGTYAMSGLQLQVGGGETVGSAGAGYFTQTLGTNTVTGYDGLRLGELNTGVGQYNLAGGTLAVSSTEYIGLTGLGTFNQIAGSNTAGSLFFAFPRQNSGGNYNLSGGSLTAGYVENHGDFNQTGGSAMFSAVNNTGTFSSIAGTLTITSSFSNSGGMTIGGTQLWGSNVTFYNQDGVTTFNSDAGSLTANPLRVEVDGGTVAFAADQHLKSIIVTNNATIAVAALPRKVTIRTRTVVTTESLAFASDISAIPGRLDLMNNELVIRNGDLATIAGQIGSGWDRGSNPGTGIVSSLGDARHRLGYQSTFGGIDVTYALAGDANLDGAVNFADLVTIAQNYNKPSTFWTGGDFDYDRTTGFSDLVTLAQNYNTGTTSLTGAFSANFAADWALAQSFVPDPTVVSLLALPLLMARRRR